MYRMSLRIEGDIAIEAFRDALANFLNLLREIEDSVTGERSVRWTLEELRHGSPAIMTWAGTPRPQRKKRRVQVITPDYAPVVGKVLLSGVRKLERGEGRPESFTDEALDATLNLARVTMRRGINALALIGEGVSTTGAPEEPNVLEVTERVAASVREIVAPRYTAPGAVEGTLQGINSRGLLYFVIYDSIYGARVRCDIPDTLKPRALAAFDERVLVTGMVARDADGHPRHIKAHDIEPIRPEGLPTSIRGLDPDFTGGLSTTEYLKRGWSGTG